MLIPMTAKLGLNGNAFLLATSSLIGNADVHNRSSVDPSGSVITILIFTGRCNECTGDAAQQCGPADERNGIIVLNLYCNSAVGDGNGAGTSDKSEHIPTNRPVDTAEWQVTINSRLLGAFFLGRQGQSRNLYIIPGCVIADVPPEQLDYMLTKVQMRKGTAAG